MRRRSWTVVRYDDVSLLDGSTAIRYVAEKAGTTVLPEDRVVARGLKKAEALDYADRLQAAEDVMGS